MSHIAFPHFNPVSDASLGKENIPTGIQLIQQVALSTINGGVQAANPSALNFVATATPQNATGFDVAALERRIIDSIEKEWPLTWLNKQEHIEFFCSHVLSDDRTFADIAFENLHLGALQLLRKNNSPHYKRIHSTIFKWLDSYITDRRDDALYSAGDLVLSLFNEHSVEAMHFMRYFLTEHKLAPYDQTETGLAARFYTQLFETIKTRFDFNTKLILAEIDFTGCQKPSLVIRAKWVNISEAELSVPKTSSYCVIQ